MGYSSVVLATSGLKNYWRLNDSSGTTAADSGPGANPQTYSGGFTLNQSPLSDGAGDSVVFNGSTGLSSTASSSFTTCANSSMEAWFRTDNFATSNQSIIWNGSGGDGVGLYVSGNSSTNGSLQLLAGGIAWQSTGILITDSNIHHVVVTFDGSKIPRVYLDGGLVFTGSAMTISNPTGAFTSTLLFNGAISDAALYNVQLSAATILQHYQAGRPSCPNSFMAKPKALSLAPMPAFRQGMVCAAYCDSSNPSRNLINNSISSQPGAGGPPSWVKGQYGLARYGFGGSFETSDAFTHAAVNRAGPWTCAALITLNQFTLLSSQSGDSPIWTLQGGAANSTNLKITNSGAISLQSSSIITTGRVLSIARPYVIAGTFDGVTGKIYLNGSVILSAAMTPLTTTLQTSSKFLTDSSGELPGDMQLHGAYIWNRCVDPSEMLRLSRDFFAPMRTTRSEPLQPASPSVRVGITRPAVIIGEESALWVPQPLLMRVNRTIGILSARPFGIAGSIEAETPAYQVPPPSIKRGPSPHPAIPQRFVTVIQSDGNLSALHDQHHKKVKIHKGKPPPAPIAPPRMILSALPTFVDDRKPIIVGAGLPTSPAPVGSPMPFLRVVIVNPMADEAIQPIIPKPAWFSTIQPEGRYRPPGIQAFAVDDAELSTLFPIPVLPTRGIVPTPAPTGAPRPFVQFSTLPDIIQTWPTQPWIWHVTPVGSPFHPCPAPVPRIDVDCGAHGRRDDGCESIVSTVQNVGKSNSILGYTVLGQTVLGVIPETTVIIEVCCGSQKADESCGIRGKVDTCCN